MHAKNSPTLLLACSAISCLVLSPRANSEFIIANTRVTDVIPYSLSGEASANSEPSIAVNPSSPSQMAISSFGDPTNANGILYPVFYSQNGGVTWPQVQTNLNW